MLKTDMKLKKRKLKTIVSTAAAIIVLSVLTVLTFTLLLPQFSFAQAGTTNTNQTPSSAQLSQVKGVITPCNVTEPTVQGPEYTPNPPVRQGQDFAQGIPGERLVLSGKVLNHMTCKPVQGAVLDIWQTNSTGDYDYKGFNLRGKIVTDKDGNYLLNTVYPESLQLDNITRPSHIHVIVGVPGQPLITTQVYFEDKPNDAYLEDSLIVKPVTDANGTKIAHFDFLVEDYRGFDISKGIAGNPTIGFISPQSNNNINNK
jgi:protocatechuate 3,4-dioxygenase beta subunit